MSDIKVNTTTAEIAVGQLSRYFEQRDGYRGSPAAIAMHDLYGRIIYTDRGAYPTQEELDMILSDYAAGLEWNPDRFEWQLDRSLLFLSS